MSAVIKANEIHSDNVPEISGTASILAIIDRAARDPTVDIDKMERLMAMFERTQARTAKASYTEALASMQPELPAIVERGGIKDRAGNIQSTYALWEDINKVIKPILARHGFALSFKTGHEGEKIVVTGILSHKAGHSEETQMALPADKSGSKNEVQAVASSISYGQRYTARALLNLTSVGSDNDGQGGGGGAEIDTIGPGQLADLKSLMDEVKANEKAFLVYMRVAKLEDILVKDYSIAVAALESKRSK